MTMRSDLLPALLFGAVLALPACHQAKAPPANSLDAMDNQLVEGTATNDDNSSLGAAIKVDRNRAGKAAASAARTSEDATDGTCMERNRDRLDYNNSWATKLPADLPLHPLARLTEAAGHSGDCEIRAVSFTVNDQPEAVIAWYQDQATKKGWDAGRTTRDGDAWLAGTKGNAAFTVMTQASAKGTDVDYIWESGN